MRARTPHRTIGGATAAALGRCRDCGEPVLFVRHARTGKVAPIERSTLGHFAIALSDRGHLEYFHAEPGERDRFQHHAASCRARAAERERALR